MLLKTPKATEDNDPCILPFWGKSRMFFCTFRGASYADSFKTLGCSGSWSLRQDHPHLSMYVLPGDPRFEQPRADDLGVWGCRM